MSTYKVASELTRANTDSSSGIYCVSTSEDTLPPVVDPIALTELPSKGISRHRRSSRTGPLSKHTNLDLKPLSLTEKLTLYRLYYCQLPTLIHHLSVLVCIVWSCFSMTHITKIYHDHNTSTKIVYSPPNWTYPPAVSFCLPGLVNLLTKTSIKPETVYLRDLLDNNQLVSWLKNDTKREVDIDIQCTFIANSMTGDVIERNCSDFTKMIISIQSGVKCFTMFSDLYGKQTAKNMKMYFDYNPTVNFHIGGNLLNFYPPDNKSAMVNYIIHDRDVFPHFQDVRRWDLFAGNHTEFQFTINQWQFMNGCFKYRKHKGKAQLPEDLEPSVLQWNDALVSEDGRPLYRSQGECSLYCLWRRSYRNVSIGIYTPHTLDLVQRMEALINQQSSASESQIKGAVNEKRIVYRPIRLEEYLAFVNSTDDCAKLCVQACKSVNYVNGYHLEARHLKRGRINADDTVAYLTVRWATGSVSSVSFEDTLDLLDAVGYIGGLIHIWLSLSVLGIIRYLLRVAPFRASSPLYTLGPVNWFLRWRSQNKGK